MSRPISIFTFLLLAWFGCPSCLAAESEIPVKALPAIEELSFPDGYAVYASPDVSQAPTKRVPGPATARVAAYAEIPSGRLFLSDWSYERKQKGQSHFWIFLPRPSEPEAGASPGGGAHKAVESITLLPPQIISPPKGYTVYGGPDTALKPLKVVTEEEEYEEITAAAFLKTPMGRMYLTADGLKKLRRGAQAEWIYIPGVSNLPEFQVPATAERIDGEENGREQFERGERLRALPTLVEEYEAMKNGEEWRGGGVLREAYNYLFCIGWSFASIGDFAQAETALLWHADVAESWWGPFDRRGGLVPKSNLCEFYRSIGNVGKEMRLRQEAFELHAMGNYEGQAEEDAGNDASSEVAGDSYRQAFKALKSFVEFAGNDQIECYNMFLEIVRLSVRHGKLAEAERFTADLKEVLDWIDRAEDAMGMGPGLHEEGRLVLVEWALRRGKPAEAAKILAGVKEKRDDVLLEARVALATGDAAKCIKLLEPELPKLAFTDALPARQLLQAAYHDSKRMDDLARVTDELARIQVERTSQVLGFSSEEQRVRFMKQLRPLSGWLESGNTAGIARAALRFKGLTLDAALQEADARLTSKDPKIRALQTQLEGTRHEAHVALRLMEAAERDPKAEARYTKAAAEIDRLEGLLSRELASTGLVRDALRRDPEEITRGLTPERCVVDFVLADRHVAGLTYEPIYLAIRYSADGIAMHVCGAAAGIDEKVSELRALIEKMKASDEVVRKSLTEMRTLLFGNLLDGRGQGTTLLVSPDGSLNFLPFAALMDGEGVALVTKYDLGLITSAREGLAPVKPWKVGKGLLIGNPAYDKMDPAPGGGKRRVTGQRGVDFSRMKFGDLPGAEAEAHMIDQCLKAAGRESSLLTNTAATEAAFRNAPPADLVHIATHGALLRPEGLPGEEQIVLGQMTHGIVAFAGANPTLAEWARGQGGAPENDGILSADEFARIDLGGVHTLVLSACETGLGGSVAGEGVMGLRRGIHQAGVANLVSTLWEINDAATVEVMERFYKRILQSDEAPLAAMSATQRELFALWHEGKPLAETVNHVSPFTISISPGRAERRLVPLVDSPVPVSPRSESRVEPAAIRSGLPSAAADEVPQMEGERYPATRLRALTAEDVADLDFGAVRYAINEMFARHGATFPKPEISAVFAKYRWYQPRAGVTFEEIEAQSFSPVERANLKVLGDHRDRVKR